jgi:hypothetical protein
LHISEVSNYDEKLIAYENQKKKGLDDCIDILKKQKQVEREQRDLHAKQNLVLLQKAKDAVINSTLGD